MQPTNGVMGANFCTTSSLLTATGAVTTHDSTVLLNFSIGGKAYTKSGTNATQTTPTTDYITGAAFPPLVGGASVSGAYGHGCAVLWAYNSSGAVKCMMGPHVNLDSAGAFTVNPQFPIPPDDVCVFAYQLLKAGATASATAIVFGTALWNATGFTQVIQNVLVLPDRPQSA